LHYYISREWLHRLSTFAHPGPITNHDFLCQHSQILPRRAARLTNYYATISSSLWDLLYEKFGGGPVSSELHYCLQCQNEYQMMKRRREYELKTYITLETFLEQLKEEHPELTYSYYMPPNIIAKTWIEKWKAFVDGNELEPPGPIDNKILLISNNKNDSKPQLRASSQYRQIQREVWLFFHSQYGGGPELLCMPENHPTAEKLRELTSEVQQKIMSTLESRKQEDDSEQGDDSSYFLPFESNVAALMTTDRSDEV
uniref:DUSP domain-containing protein n=1 Tax=Gongylonema pulchrum TaxID=637853 RepID=A0A183EI09_9BILA